MENGKCIIICAPSGAGKTSITKYLLGQDLNLEFSVSACNRKQRPNEINGEDYYFLSLDEFKQNIKDDKFVEWEEVYKEQYYGTLKSEIDKIWAEGKNVIFDVDVEGGLSLTKYFGEKALALFILPPSLEVLKERLHQRGTENQRELDYRLAKAEKEIDYAKWFDTVIINKDLEVAQQQAYKVIKNFIANK